MHTNVWNQYGVDLPLPEYYDHGKQKKSPSQEFGTPFFQSPHGSKLETPHTKSSHVPFTGLVEGNIYRETIYFNHGENPWFPVDVPFNQSNVGVQRVRDTIREHS